MSIEIKVPPLGESVTEATIAKLYKKVGDAVKMDELLVELETDKVTLEVNAPADGVMASLAVAEGDLVTIGQVLGAVAEGSTASAIKVEAAEVKAGVTQPFSKQSPVPSASADYPLAPSVRKMAAESNMDVTTVKGTGKDGRIIKGDIIDLFSGSSTTSAIAGPREERVKMTRLRKRIAERLKDSQNNAAILTTFNEIDMSNVIAIRNKYKDIFEKKHKVKIGFMSFFVKAAIVALKELPGVNAQIDGDDIIYKNHYDIGVAVGTDQGLVVPVVRSADEMSFANIEKTISGLGQKAREGKLTMADMSGGTFTISNGGIYGSLLSTPIINPPQSGILGMHKIAERPVAINGKVEIRPMMYIALSYDHRLIDGKEAVTFLIRVKECVEDPERLLFDL